MGDLIHFAHQVPAATVERRMSLAPVVAARQAAAPRPGWCAVFVKALSLVAAARPELRRAYMSLPWPHLYEHGVTIASVAVERQVGDEEAVLFAHLRSPDERGLQDLDAHLRYYKEEPLAEIGLYRRILRVSRLPRPLRRMLWWLALRLYGRWRARFLGTLGLSVVAGLGASIPHILSPLTTTLNYGVIDEDGTVDVRLTFDHRVLDGAMAARALEDLERVLKCEIVNELGYFRRLEAA
jgi:hypothetical protein